MDKSQSKLSPQEVFKNKKLFSNKIHARVLKVTEEILETFDKLKVGNEDKDAFLSAVNHYYYDLCEITFHLRQVVILIGDDDKQTVSDLQDVINRLNKIVPAVQECLNLETEKLITQLKISIADVGPQVENLMKIIEYDNLHEGKQKILDIQHDLVLSIEALKLYCQSSYLTLPELEGLIHEEIEKVKSNLIKIRSGHEDLTDDFLHYTRHSTQKLQNLLNYLRKLHNTENFEKDVANMFKHADEYAVLYISEILGALDFDNPIVKMLDVIENCHANVHKASLEFQNEIQIDMPIDIGKKDNQKLMQFFLYIYIYGINALSALNWSIEDAIMKK